MAASIWRSGFNKDSAMPENSFRPARPAIIVRRPIHPMLISFPVACFTGTLLTDIAYWSTAEMMWADFSAWLVSAGFVLAVLAAVAGLIDFIVRPFIVRLAARAQGPAWPYALGNVLVLALAALNTLVHSRDAWTSVVPLGLILSTATVAVLLLTGWLRWTLARQVDPAETAE